MGRILFFDQVGVAPFTVWRWGIPVFPCLVRAACVLLRCGRVYLRK